MTSLPESFYSFIKPDADRLSIIQHELDNCGTEYAVLPLGGKKHLYVRFPAEAYNPLFKIKTVLVHYDRVPDTPGANDNSAAVFEVISWIKRLQQFSVPHNIRIFFTDGEEMGTAPAQGAYSLAAGFRQLGITHDDVIVLDGCGRGNVLVISSAGRHSNGNAGFKKHFDELYERTIQLAKLAAGEDWITVPVPYSDNAGFLASGIPAIAVTVLPQEEATAYMRQLQKDKNLEKHIMTKDSRLDKTTLPRTWNMMHTAEDAPENLTETAFALTAKFLDALARQHTLA